MLSSSLEAQLAADEVALARADELGAGRWPNPSVEWERESGSEAAGAKRQDTLLASIPLVISGRLGLEEDAAEQGVLAAEARADRARAELRWRAVRAFYSVVAADQRRATLERSLGPLGELTNAVEAREKAGSAAGYDMLRIQVEHASIEGQLRIAAVEAKRAQAEALQLLGPDAAKLPALQGALPIEKAIPALADLLGGLEQRRADVRELGLEAASADSTRRAAARSWVPDPSVNAGAQLFGADDGDLEVGYVVGVTVPLPLFERRQGEEARAEAKRTLAQTRRSLLLHSARTRLTTAFEEVTSQREQVARHRSDVLSRTAELRQIAAAAYRGGSSELLALVDAERAARDAELTDIALGLALVGAEADLLLLAGAYDGADHRSAP